MRRDRPDKDFLKYGCSEDIIKNLPFPISLFKSNRYIRCVTQYTPHTHTHTPHFQAILCDEASQTDCSSKSHQRAFEIQIDRLHLQSFWSGRSRVGSENLCFCQVLKWGWCHLFKDHIWHTTLPEENNKNGRNTSSFSLSYSFPCCQWLCVEWRRKKELINTCDSALCEISLSTWPSLNVGILDPEALQGQGPSLALNIYLRLWF